MSLRIDNFKVMDKTVINFYKGSDGSTMAQAKFEHGWHWASHVKPHTHDEHLCSVSHTGYCVKGTMLINTADGKEYLIKGGDFYHIEPGHDAYVTSEEGCEMIDFLGGEKIEKEWKE